MEDLRQLVEICERPIADVSNEVIDSLQLIQLQQLCAVHEISNDGDVEQLRERIKDFRNKNGHFAPIKEIGTLNGKPPAFPRQKPPTNLWAATQQPATNVCQNLSTYTATTAASTITTCEQNGKNPNRAIHRIHLRSIQHNYNLVQSTAAKQQCQVIVVVKADGYGHGSISSSIFLVEHCGAEAFAVATLEEGLALRKALDEHFSHVVMALERVRPRVRILVLGAPVGYPSCFDTYLHYDIELMVSGPEVAASLGQWMRDHDARRRAEVLRAAESTKEELIGNDSLGLVNPMRNMVVRQGNGEIDRETGEVLEPEKQAVVSEKVIKDSSFNISSSEHTEQDVNAVSPSLLQTKMNAATLTNVTGNDLAREVRQILIGQKHATTAAKPNNAPKHVIGAIFEERSGADARSSSPPTTPSKGTSENARATSPKPPKNTNNPTVFCGIDDAARASRQKEMRIKRLSELGSEAPGSRRSSGVDSDVPLIRKKLRWHALVDSGMGRLGFTTRETGDTNSRSGTPTECDPKEPPVDDGSEVSSLSSVLPRDTIEIIQELYDAEVHDGSPIGEC